MSLFSKKKGVDEVEAKIRAIDSAVSQSFARVKTDTSAIFDWIHRFNSYAHNLRNHALTLRNALSEQRKTTEMQQAVIAEQQRFIAEQKKQLDEQQRELRELRLMLMNMPKSPEDIKRLVDAYYSFDALADRLKRVEERLAAFEHERTYSKHKAEAARATEPSPCGIAEGVEERPAEQLNEGKTRTDRVRNLRERIMRKLTKNSKDYVKNVILSLINKYGRISGTQLREIVVEEQGLCSKSSFYRMLDELREEEGLGVSAEGKEKVFSAKNLRPRTARS